MANWSKFSAQEIERRRSASVEAMSQREQERFMAWYQQQCDTDYWKFGQRCSGCDFWQSEGGGAGRCTAAAIVPGADVLRSIGITWSTWVPEPGHPFTESSFWCGRFKDDFDWSTLDELYLHKIGAMKKGVLMDKPKPPQNRRPEKN